MRTSFCQCALFLSFIAGDLTKCLIMGFEIFSFVNKNENLMQKFAKVLPVGGYRGGKQGAG